MSDDYADRLADLASEGLSSEQARTCAGKGLSPLNLRPHWVCARCGYAEWNCDCEPLPPFEDTPPAAPARPSTRPERKTRPVPHPEVQDDSGGALG